MNDSGQGCTWGARLPRAPGAVEAAKIRRYETVDIAERIAVISPEALKLTNYPLKHPVTAFNPSLYVSGNELRLFIRVTVGYYRYASAVALARLGLEEVMAEKRVPGDIEASIVVYPSTRYDIWGVEDPRVYRVGERLYMTYTGRTVSYFDATSTGRTIPVTAVSENEGYTWRKSFIHVVPSELTGKVVSDKNAFMHEVDGLKLFFHRLHLVSDEFLTIVSCVEEGEETGNGLRELISSSSSVVVESVDFESKNGWAAPPIRVGSRDLLVLLHGVDRDGVYRVFAVLLEHSRSEGIVVKAVTPRYIMEPRELYEVYGDRPYVVFPCGASLVDDSTLLLSYGAADQFVGLAAIDLDSLFAELDRGRIY
ncbi:MAG TPA: glycosidase [Pyrodictium delaneyi]|uniref:Glycosidase n=1 Tax=Pyrodictium delaneyi TaxID=1273541 RepID=A0A833E9I1_9CREN|nr:glycosidase [Pyrodictium delaneyi]